MRHTIMTNSNLEIWKIIENILLNDRQYRLILLRHKEISIDELLIDDLDLLIAHNDFDHFLLALQNEVVKTNCHLLIRRSKPIKYDIQIISKDFGRSIKIDLWLAFDQAGPKKTYLIFEDFESKIFLQEGNIWRLQSTLEFLLYVQHLFAKEKNLSSPSVSKRIDYYIQSLARAKHTDSNKLIRIALDILETQKITSEVHEIINKLLSSELSLKKARFKCVNGPLRRMENYIKKVLSFFISMCPKYNAIGIIGLDGVGKTSLIGEIVGNDKINRVVRSFHPLVGKHLYRRAFLFRGIYKINRSTLRLKMEKVDELLGTIAFLTSYINFLNLQGFHDRKDKKVAIFDRFLPDFLYVGRKGNHPSVSLFGKLINRCLPYSAKIIHLTLPYENLVLRKKEISRKAYSHYLETMLLMYAKRLKVDYLLLNNAGTIDDSVHNIGVYLKEY